MKCPNCDKDLGSDSLFCTNCGTKIKLSSQVGVEYEIKYRPSYSMLIFKLKPGQMIVAEAGSLTYMTPNIQVNTRKREKSILGTLGLKLLGGQSLFVNEYWTDTGKGEIGLVAAPVGDISKLDVNPSEGYVVQKTAYIASSPNIDLDIKWQGFTKGLFGQGLFMIKATGKGDLFINTFGAIDRHVLKEGESLIVDNFHLVAFSNTCQYTVQKFGGWKETLLSGEGLVTHISGPGEVLLQTKNLREFANWIWVLLEPKVRSTAR